MKHRTIDSPFGPVSFTVENDVIVRIKFQQGEPDYIGADPLLAETSHQLRQYFEGSRYEFDLPLAPGTTLFQTRIRAAMMAIPYGEMRTYGDLAQELASASQAVGQGCGSNPIPIVVP